MHEKNEYLAHMLEHFHLLAAEQCLVVDSTGKRTSATLATTGVLFRHVFRRSQLRLNMLAGSGQAVGSLLLAALSYKVYLSFLGYELYGLWLSLSVVLTLAQFGNAGLSPAITKFVAEAHCRGDHIALRSCISTAHVALAATGTLLALLVIVLRTPLISLLKLNPAMEAHAVWLIPWLAILSVYALQVDVMTAALCGLGRMDFGSTLQILSRVMVFASSTALLIAGCGVASLLVATLTGYAFLHIMAAFRIHRITGVNCLSPRAFEFDRLRDLLRIGSGVFACSLLTFLMAPFNKLVLTRFAGVAFVPIYELAWVLMMQLRGVLESGLRALFPELCRLQAPSTAEGATTIAQLYRKSMKLAVFGSLAIFSASALVLPVILKIWLGYHFDPMVPFILRILFLGGIASAASVPAYYALLAHGRVGCLIIGHTLQSGCNILVIIAAIITTRQVSPAIVAIAVTLGMCAAAAYFIPTGHLYGIPARRPRFAPGEFVL